MSALFSTYRRRSRRWRTAFTVTAGIFGLVMGVLMSLAQDWLGIPNSIVLLTSAALSAGAVGIVEVVMALRGAKRASELSSDARQQADAAFQQVVSSFTATALPSAKELTLLEEVAEVSDSLSATVRRLGTIMTKAQTFETEVKGMVERAESAEAMIKINEADARRISLLVGAAAQDNMRADLERMIEKFEKMTIKHAAQIEQLRTSGRRLAFWTFIGGVLLGLAGNVVVALIMAKQ